MASISSSAIFLILFAFIALGSSKSIAITPEGQIITGEEHERKQTLFILGTVDGKTYFLKDCSDEIFCPYMDYTEAKQACLGTNYNLTLATVETRNQTDMIAYELQLHWFWAVWASASEEITGSSFIWDDASGRSPDRSAFAGDWDHTDYDGSQFPKHYCGTFHGRDKRMSTSLCSLDKLGLYVREILMENNI